MSVTTIDQSVLLAIIAVLVISIFGLLNRKPATKKNRVYPVIRGIASQNPKYRVSQHEAMKIVKDVPGIDSVRHMIEPIYSNSKIDYRHLVIPDFSAPEERKEDDELFFNGDFNLNVQTRLNKFRETAVPLVTEASRKAIENAGIKPEDIQKLIVVSSTGFLGPGLDCELIRSLGLSRGVDRSLIGFMGCAAAMNGFRTAVDYVKANPGKYALLVCVEISSIHTVFEDNVNDAIIHAIFSDGCAATVISGETDETVKKGDFAVVDEHSWLMEGTEDGVTLAINDTGISCKLSKYLPQYVANNIGAYVDGFLTKNNLTKDDMDFWAIHPGGRRIIEEVQNGLKLPQEKCQESWDVLASNGNMLSPTVMFILERIFLKNKKLIAEGKEGLKNGIAFAFSPGVGAEGILIQRV